MDLRVLCDGKCDCIDHVTCEDETLLCDKSPLDINMLPQFLLGKCLLRFLISHTINLLYQDRFV